MTDQNEPDPLTPDEEAAVHELLAALPDPQLPADVERRIAAAVAGADAGADADADAPEPSSVVPVAADTSVLPLEPSDEATRSVLAGGAPSARWRSPWLLQSAAVLVIVALIGAVVVGVVTRDDDSASNTPLALSQEKAGPITSSGRDYTGTTLAGQVRGLLVADGSTASAPAPTAQGPTPGASGDSAQSQSLSMKAKASGSDDSGVLASTDGGTAADSKSSGDTAASAADGEDEGWSLSDPTVAKVNALVNDPKLRQACIDQLASVPGALPVAIDAGRYDGKPAAIFVLPDESDPAKVAVWVVGPTCSSADNPFPYRYERVVRP